MKNVSTGSGMMNTGKRALGLGEDLIREHDVLRSFSGNQKQEIENTCIPDTGVHFYIGSLAQDQSGFYNEPFIKGSLDAMIKKLPNNTPIHLDMAGSVSILLNTEVPALSIEEQIFRVKKIVNTDYKKYAHRIHIHNLADRHEELLNHVTEDGVNGLSEEPGEDSGSLYLAHKLYQLSQENNKFFKKIVSTKPGKPNASDELSDNDYYALIEVAMRLQDLLDGISLQGGESRQKRYDSIILDILNDRYEGSDVLDQLNDILSNIDNNALQRIYFDKNNAQKMRNEKNLINIVRWSLLTVVATLGLLGYFIHHTKVSEDRRVNDSVNEIIDSKFQYKDPKMYMSQGMFTYERERSIPEEVKLVGENITNQFINRYGTGKTNKEQIIHMVFDQLNRRGSIPLIRATDIHSYENFIDNEFIPDNSVTLTKLGIDIGRVKYRNRFLKTYFSDLSGDVPENFKGDIKDKQKYTMREGYMTYDVGSLNCYTLSVRDVPQDFMCPGGPKMNNIIVARPIGMDGSYSFDEGKEVAYDYLNNYVVKDYVVYIGNILGQVYDQNINREDITKKILELQYEGHLSMDDIRKQDFIQSISIVEQYFLENHDRSSSLGSILSNTINLDIDTLPDDVFYGKYIGAITLNKSYTDHLYIIESEGQKYLVTFPTNLGNYSTFSKNSFSGSDVISKKILELL